MRINSALNSLGFIPLFIIGIVSAVLFSLSGVLIFADSAKPGDVLYAVDKSIEKVQLTLTTEKAAKAKLESSLALERAKELNQAVSSKDTKKIAQAAEEHEIQLQETIAQTNELPEDLSLKETNEIVGNIEKQKAVIDELLKNVIGEEKDSLQNAKNNADNALINTYEQLKNKVTETKKDKTTHLNVSGGKLVEIQAIPSCSEGHDGYSNHIDLTIKADMQNSKSLNTVLSITDQKTNTTAYFAVMKNGFVLTEIKAHDDLGSLRGPLFRLKLEGDGREYKIQALAVQNTDDRDLGSWHQNVIGETTFTKNCNSGNDTHVENNTPTPTPTVNPNEKATYALIPSKGTLNRGCTYDITVELNTNGIKTGGADVSLLYDTNVFSIDGMKLKKGTMYAEYLLNMSQSKPGKIEYTGLSSITTSVSGKGVFATFPFKVLETASLGETKINFDFDSSNPGKTTDSNVAEYITPGSGTVVIEDLLTSVTNGVYTISTGSCN